MRSDVLAVLSGVFPSRVPTKETLNHPDLATSRGPVFPPAFCDRWIFPRYERILERLLALPIADLMFENPATSLERVLGTWGEAGRGFIGGLYGDVSMEKLLAYFRTRDRMGIPAEV